MRLPEHLAPERRERLMQVGATSRLHRALEGEIAFEERLEITTSDLDPLMPTRGLPRRRIPLLNGLRQQSAIQAGDAAVQGAARSRRSVDVTTLKMIQP